MLLLEQHAGDLVLDGLVQMLAGLLLDNSIPGNQPCWAGGPEVGEDKNSCKMKKLSNV